MGTAIRYISLPRTEPPPEFIEPIISTFRSVEDRIGTERTQQRMESNQVLRHLEAGLRILGFEVEAGKRREQKITRPVFFGLNGSPILRYEIDAYHQGWRCGLEVEAVRALRGGAVYRDLVQAMVMVQVDHLCIAVPNYLKVTARPDRTFEDTLKIVDALFGHGRVKIPYGLTVIGY